MNTRNETVNPQTIGIIGAMEAEVELLKNSLNHLNIVPFGKNIQVYTGKFADKDIALCQSGIGKVNAAIATALLCEHFTPDCIINTGSAGGIGEGLQIGDVVIGTHTAHHDVDATAFGYRHGQVPQLPLLFDSHPHLVQTALSAAKSLTVCNTAHGLILSGDRFIHDSGTLTALLNHFPDAQAVEMEAAAIAQTCYQLEKPFVVIRSVSDTAQNDAKVSFETFLKTAAEHSANMVLAMIKQL